MLLPAIPLFALAEERTFRRGCEQWSWPRRVRRTVEFGLAHALIGIPIGVALALSCGGAYFMAVYLRAYRVHHDAAGGGAGLGAGPRGLQRDHRGPRPDHGRPHRHGRGQRALTAAAAGRGQPAPARVSPGRPSRGTAGGTGRAAARRGSRSRRPPRGSPRSTSGSGSGPGTSRRPGGPRCGSGPSGRWSAGRSARAERLNAGGSHASLIAASCTWSTGRGSVSRIHPPASARSPAVNGSGPMAQRVS